MATTKKNSYGYEDLVNGTGYDLGGDVGGNIDKESFRLYGDDEQLGSYSANDAIRLMNATNDTVGKDTSATQTTSPTQDIPAFSYANAPSYTSKYQEQINSMIDSILNRDAFSYDAESDPLYRQYRDQYTRNGGRAMVDTLGQVSARTGGLASSYAGQAAQQTYNGYMDELNNKVPELYQLAYSMYQDRDKTDRQNLSLLQALEDQDYNRYLDQLAQYNKNRSMAYNQYQDQLKAQNALNEAASGLYSGSGDSASAIGGSTDDASSIFTMLKNAGAKTEAEALNYLHSNDIGDKAYRDDLAKAYSSYYSDNNTGAKGVVNTVKDSLSEAAKGIANSKVGQLFGDIYRTSTIADNAIALAKEDKNRAKAYLDELLDADLIKESRYQNLLKNIDNMK